MRDHQDEAHYIDEFLDFLLDNYKEDARLMQWMGDHLYGKAQQSVDLTSDGEPVQIAGFNFLTNGGANPNNQADA